MWLDSATKIANSFVYFKSSYRIIIKKRQKEESSIHGSIVLTVRLFKLFAILVSL